MDPFVTYVIVAACGVVAGFVLSAIFPKVDQDMVEVLHRIEGMVAAVHASAPKPATPVEAHTAAMGKHTDAIVAHTAALKAATPKA